MSHRLRHHRLACRRFAHVAHRHLALPARRANLIAHLAQVGLVAAGDQHGSGARGELARNASADAGGASGYDGDFAFDTKGIVRIHVIMPSSNSRGCAAMP